MFKRIISLLQMLIMVLTVVLTPLGQVVYGEREETQSANQMGTKMINFFQDKQNDLEMQSLSPSELRIYGVFMSNFYEIGETKLGDVKSGAINERISKVFFGGGNTEKVAELNEIVYKGAVMSIRSEGKLTNGSGETLSGDAFLQELGKSNGRIKFNGGKSDMWGLRTDAVRGALKIVAARSGEFLLKADGVQKFKSMYVDTYGNVWGSFEEKVDLGDASEQQEVKVDDYVLVVPACLNPAAFTNTSIGTKTDADFKIPLNNAFAIGSLVGSEKIDRGRFEATGSEIPYYNLPEYFGTEDRNNALMIYGISSPLGYLYNTDMIQNKNITVADVRRSLVAYATGDLSVSSNFRVVMGNRLDVMSGAINPGIIDKIWRGEKEQSVEVYQYLFGTHVVPFGKIEANMYYFGVNGNPSWADAKFEEIGVTGINMYGRREGTRVKINDGNMSSSGMTMKVINTLKANQDASIVPASLRKGSNSQALTGMYQKAYIKGEAPSGSFWSSNIYIHGLNEKGIKGFSRSDKVVHDALGVSSSVSPNGSLATNSNVYSKEDEIGKRTALFHTLHTYNVVGAQVKASKDTKSKVTFSGQDFKVTNRKAGDDTNWPGIFWGYMVSMLEMEAMTKEDDEGNIKIDAADFNTKYLPSLPNGLVTGGSIDLSGIDGNTGVSKGEDVTMLEMQKDLIRKIYGILSDDQNAYRDSWLKATIDGFVLSVHRTITGSWMGESSTISAGAGGNTYGSIVGYVNTPSLYELPFTAWIMTNYMQIYIIAMLLIIVVLVLMVMLNMRTGQQGIMIFVIMVIALLAPNIVVENTINMGNKVTDRIYSEKFDFWALTQHEQSTRRLSGAGSDETLEYILQRTAEKTNEMYSGDPGVRVKWMAPKKTGVFDNIFTSKHVGDNLAVNLNIFKWLVSSFVYEQEFATNDPFATYLYRPYNAIARDAQEYYKYSKETIQDSTAVKRQGTATHSNDKGDVRQQGGTYHSILMDILDKSHMYKDGIYNDYFYGSTVWSDKGLLKKDNIFKIYWSADKYEDVTVRMGQYPTTLTEEQRSVSLWGLGSKDVTEVIFKNGSEAEPGMAGIQNVLPPAINETTDMHLVGFYKHTESPFYYFYTTMKARYGEGRSFKNSLLNVDIYKTRETGAKTVIGRQDGLIRDFLDLEGMFTNVIPYMSVSNSYVYDWTRVNGTEVPAFDFGSSGGVGSVIDGFAFGDTGKQQAYEDDMNTEFNRMTVLKADMERVWNMYAPWVDQLNSLGVYNQKAKAGGKTIRIGNALNPSHYYKAGRPMVFSEADMRAKGYNIKDLTDIEMRIQRVQETTYRDMQYLVNYYDLDDEVLLTAAAMYATFNFNREFSQTRFFGDSVMLYPQNFEMKNFNYDAFMRLILLNSTGETIFSSKDLYERVLAKTSIITGILLIVVDILAVIVIPTMKLIILLMLLFLGIMLCITCAISPPEKLINVVGSSLIMPSLLFMGTNITFAFLVSLLVGNGLTAYVGDKGVSVATNDPTVTIALLILVSVLYIMALFKIIKVLIANYRAHGLTGVIAGLGIIGGAMATGTSKIKGKLQKGGEMVGGGVVGAAMSEKGSRLKGVRDGVKTGFNGGSVYDERSREKRHAKDIANAMKEANGEKMSSKWDEKASSTGDGSKGVGEKVKSEQRVGRRGTGSGGKGVGRQSLKERIGKITPNIRNPYKSETNTGVANMAGGVIAGREKLVAAGQRIGNNFESLKSRSKEAEAYVRSGGSAFMDKLKGNKGSADVGSITAQVEDKAKKGVKYAGQSLKELKKSADRKVKIRVDGVKDYTRDTQRQIKEIDEKAKTQRVTRGIEGALEQIKKNKDKKQKGGK